LNTKTDGAIRLTDSPFSQALPYRASQQDEYLNQPFLDTRTYQMADSAPFGMHYSTKIPTGNARFMRTEHSARAESRADHRIRNGR
jgi:hypothetical protein